ncbi:MAG TPA: hypothetical protein VKC57_16465 [Ktedonobacterales bacterium]|nr:hypothetical protein [Ktedonobacterales bacterium]
MKKLLFLAAVCAAAYYAYTHWLDQRKLRDSNGMRGAQRLTGPSPEALEK